jgi:hypothetical protein
VREASPEPPEGRPDRRDDDRRGHEVSLAQRCALAWAACAS